MSSRGVFVAGAGTDVGKTYVACGLVEGWRRAGRSVRAFKPVASGFADPPDPAFAFADSDTARLLKAQGREATPEAVAYCSPWRFRAPLSPDMAAAAEGRSLRFQEIKAWASTLRAAADDERLLVEGVGGVMSPLAEDALNVDLISALGLPVVLVGGSYLGALSHGLTALTVLRARSLEVAALVVSETAGGVDLEATCEAFRRFAPETRVVALSRGAPVDPHALGLD